MKGTTVRRSPGRKGTPRTEPNSKLPQAVADVLGKHVVWEVESIDRMYLNASVPRLQIVEGALRFIREQRGAKVASTNATPGPFRTRVITDGVIPSLHIDYQGTRIQQDHQEGPALRTETTINNTRDFYIGKRLANLPALRKIGFQANRRVREVQTIAHASILAEETLQQLQQLRAHLVQVLGQPEENLTQGRMSYHLRRLRLHGLIQRLPQTHRYRLTDFGLRTALFCTRSYASLG